MDHVINPRKVKAPVIRLDLTNPDHVQLAMTEVRRADSVWLGPPCGTSSRAWSIPIKKLRKAGAPSPNALKERPLSRGYSGS